METPKKENLKISEAVRSIKVRVRTLRDQIEYLESIYQDITGEKLIPKLIPYDKNMDWNRGEW